MNERSLKPIQPIATRFGGIIYRSRLEARWAAFFTRLGLAFTYEPEGYELAGGWYLPDFNIDIWGVFAEVKPAEPSPGELAKCKELARLSERPVILLIGQPISPQGRLFYSDGFEASCALSECRRCPAIVASYWTEPTSNLGAAWGTDCFGCCQGDRDRCGDKVPSQWSGTESAAQWAQNQKFGERGA